MNNNKNFQQMAKQPSQNDAADISRRDFLRLSSLFCMLISTYPVVAVRAETLAESGSIKADRSATALWSDDPVWQSIAQVQETLFPAGENIPGAKDIGATDYLYRAIESSGADSDDKDFIFRGIGWLDDLTRQTKNKGFLQLETTEQEEMIAIIVRSTAGQNWVSTLLTYTIEALLTDPVYGGNKNRIGWSWLEHQPGYPSPSADKTWQRLLQKRYKA